MQTQQVHQQSDSQGVVVEMPSSDANGDVRMRRNKKILRALGATETVLGLICSVLGTAAVAHINNLEDITHDPCHYGSSSYQPYDYGSHSYNHYDYGSILPYKSNYFPCPYYTTYLSYHFNVGEGLWGGVWVIIGGSLGIACGKKTVTSCLVKCHLGFSIVAAIFSAAMFATAIPMAFVYQTYSFGVGIEVTIAMLSFVSLVLCIASAALCCCASPINMGSSNCCGSCCDQNQPLSEGNVMYVRTNQTFGQRSPQTVVETVPYVVQGAYSSSRPQSVYVHAAPQQQPHQAALPPSTTSHTVAPHSYPTGAVQGKRQEAFDTNHIKHDDQPPLYE